MNLHPSQFIVIGDTPNDIACARHFGARSVAVATGRNNSPELLQSHQPDVLLLNLRNTKGVLVALDSL
jgi:phosphoglycolate phosphatase-like HAD superfamily hydrolase